MRRFNPDTDLIPIRSAVEETERLLGLQQVSTVEDVLLLLKEAYEATLSPHINPVNDQPEEDYQRHLNFMRTLFKRMLFTLTVPDYAQSMFISFGEINYMDEENVFFGIEALRKGFAEQIDRFDNVYHPNDPKRRLLVSTAGHLLGKEFAGERLDFNKGRSRMRQGMKSGVHTLCNYARDLLKALDEAHVSYDGERAVSLFEDNIHLLNYVAMNNIVHIDDVNKYRDQMPIQALQQGGEIKLKLKRHRPKDIPGAWTGCPGHQRINNTRSTSGIKKHLGRQLISCYRVYLPRST